MIYNYDDIGHVENESPGLCAACATANSFFYLWSRFPETYKGTQLFDDINQNGKIDNPMEVESVRNILNSGWRDPKNEQVTREGMAGGSPRFASHRSIWEAKAYHLHDFAPGTTVVKGMSTSIVGSETWFQGDKLQLGAPTWDFLWQQIQSGENVEIGFSFLDPKPEDPLNESSHMVTLTGMSFTDSNGNEMWDSGEGDIYYLDPNAPERHADPSGFLKAQLTRADGLLKFTWDNGGANAAAQAEIFMAYSESIPEPSSALLLLSGLGSIVFFRRR